MNTLVIYDQSGYILSQAQGSVREPVGVPFMYVDIPTKKYVSSIDVTDPLNPVPVLVDVPKSQIELVQDENADLRAQLAATNADLASLMETVYGA